MCNGAETYTGQTVTLTATASDPNSHDTLHYEWAIDGPGVLGDGTGINTEASVVWRAGKAGTDTRITVTVVDRENPEASDKLEASATVTIRTVAPPDCYISLSGNLTDFGQGTGFPVGADVGQLYYALSRDNRCTDPVLSDFRTTAPDWIRALSMDTSTDRDHPRENKDGWDHFIEFQVDANPTYAIRQADVWVAGSSERSTLRQQAATRPRPTCPTTAITHTRTGWTVGGRYRGSGFTQPWAKMGYGTPGGCRVNGLSLSQPGHVKVCGYNVADADAQHGPDRGGGDVRHQQRLLRRDGHGQHGCRAVGRVHCERAGDKRDAQSGGRNEQRRWDGLPALRLRARERSELRRPRLRAMERRHAHLDVLARREYHHGGGSVDPDAHGNAPGRVHCGLRGDQREADGQRRRQHRRRRV